MNRLDIRVFLSDRGGRDDQSDLDPWNAATVTFRAPMLLIMRVNFDLAAVSCLFANVDILHVENRDRTGHGAFIDPCGSWRAKFALQEGVDEIGSRDPHRRSTFTCTESQMMLTDRIFLQRIEVVRHAPSHIA
ncbi:MAG: hypothetical protein IPP33_08180 [Flavobacteriales bacterium]|nr:hypothetical protein [Flavobacteriales bacterium]